GPLRKMAKIMTLLQIPHTYIGEKSALVNSEEFRRYHAFFKIMVNPYDNFAFLLTKDHLYISDSVYDQIRVKAEDEGTSHYLAYCKMFGKEVLQGSEWTLAKAILWLAEELRIEEEVETPVMNEITTFMLNWIKKDTDGTVLEYLNWLATFDIQDEMDEDHMGIQLMTIHAAKGLEWPSVIVAGCNEGILPSSQAIKADSLEDERRLAYVAWTRAEDQLILTVRPESTHGRGRYGKSPISRFIQESM
ncbi:MAG: ATP-binding domain-containing protein, partial [Thermoplasmata archaeon]|nr:ATP-binding domain-containing protein [Thermoplasmata archaeon]